MLKRLFPFMLCVGFLAGCSSTRTEVFEVTVKNNTRQPLSAGLVKNGPIESHWNAPSQIAIHEPTMVKKHWGTLIEPGQTATLGPQNGKFSEGIVAFLRVYMGDETIEELLSVSSNSPLRVDVPLYPGKSAFVITYEAGRLKAEAAEQPSPPQK